MRGFAKFSALSFCTALLVACGGGGDSGAASNSSAEGVWVGATSTEFDINLLVLENNEVWAIYGQIVNDVFGVDGFTRGSGLVSGTNFRGNGTEFRSNGMVTAGTFDSTIDEGVSLNGTFVGSQIGTFQTTPQSGTFNYNTPAQLSVAQGAWTGQLLDGDPASVTISSNGSIVGSSSGCNFTGTATPRASGKNVFDASITFGSTPCRLPSQTVSGIALAYGLANNRTQLLVALTNAQQTFGTMFFAQRNNQ